MHLACSGQLAAKKKKFKVRIGSRLQVRKGDRVVTAGMERYPSAHGAPEVFSQYQAGKDSNYIYKVPEVMGEKEEVPSRLLRAYILHSGLRMNYLDKARSKKLGGGSLSLFLSISHPKSKMFLIQEGERSSESLSSSSLFAKASLPVSKRVVPFAVRMTQYYVRMMHDAPSLLAVDNQVQS